MLAQWHDESVWILVLACCIIMLLSWVLTYLRHIDSKLSILVRQLPLSDHVKQLASDPARKIEAIKAYRQETGAGLAEAKAAVEVFMKSR